MTRGDDPKTIIALVRKLVESRRPEAPTTFKEGDEVRMPERFGFRRTGRVVAVEAGRAKPYVVLCNAAETRHTGHDLTPVRPEGQIETYAPAPGDRIRILEGMNTGKLGEVKGRAGRADRLRLYRSRPRSSMLSVGDPKGRMMRRRPNENLQPMFVARSVDDDERSDRVRRNARRKGRRRRCVCPACSKAWRLVLGCGR